MMGVIAFFVFMLVLKTAVILLNREEIIEKSRSFTLASSDSAEWPEFWKTSKLQSPAQAGDFFCLFFKPSSEC